LVFGLFVLKIRIALLWFLDDKAKYILEL